MERTISVENIAIKTKYVIQTYRKDADMNENPAPIDCDFKLVHDEVYSRLTTETKIITNPKSPLVGMCLYFDVIAERQREQRYWKIYSGYEAGIVLGIDYEKNYSESSSCVIF